MINRPKREGEMIKYYTGGGVVLALAALAVSLRCILAREYVVGDGFCVTDEWDRYCNFQGWATDKDFFVGDTLVFRFSSTKSTVAEVTKADFDGCSKGLLPANPTHVYDLSPATVNLSSAGPAYFANTIERCERQRFAINVNVVPTPPSNDVPTTSPPSVTSPNSSPPENDSSGREYEVGEGFCMSEEWDRYCNFQGWALNKDFFVGDKLVFRFSSTTSTVAEVTKADFDDCAKKLLPANPIRVYELSPAKVSLSSTGPAYFANTIENCERQRFVINVNVPTPPTNDVPTTSSSKNNSTSSSAALTTSTPSSHHDSSHSSIVGTVTGAVVGVVAFAAKIWLFTWWVQRRKKNKARLNGQVHVSSESSGAPMFNGGMNLEEGNHHPDSDHDSKFHALAL